MKRKLSVALIVFIAFFAVMTSMQAFAASDVHVKFAPAKKGDLIFYPFYLVAPNGWETRLTVINTSPTHSTVAKIVFRSYNYSEELLDFLIYLSPNDMWTGILKDDGDGKGARIYSEDGSTLNASSVFASAANPLNFPLYNPTCVLIDGKWAGYAEILASRSFDVSDVYENDLTQAQQDVIDDAGWKIDGPVAKEAIKYIYDLLDAGTLADEGYEPRNDLTGSYEFGNATLGLIGANTAQVFKDYDVSSLLSARDVSGLGSVISNNSLAEVEAAMAKENIAMKYYDRADGDISIHIFNFPTKLSRWDTDCEYLGGSEDSPYWNNEQKCRYIYATAYDTEENYEEPEPDDPFSGGDIPDVKHPICDEVNFLITVSDLFTEGWTRYNFRYDYTKADGPYEGETEDLAAIEYRGVPVLAQIVDFADGGLSIMDPAWDEGTVSVADCERPDYPYTDENNCVD